MGHKSREAKKKQGLSTPALYAGMQKPTYIVIQNSIDSGIFTIGSLTSTVQATDH